MLYAPCLNHSELAGCVCSLAGQASEEGGVPGGDRGPQQQRCHHFLRLRPHGKILVDTYIHTYIHIIRGISDVDQKKTRPNQKP